MINERFILDVGFVDSLHQRDIPWGFGLFSQVVYYRTYSRIQEDGTQEHWADTIVRVVEGVMSIRKDWFTKMGLHWNESVAQEIAHELATAMLDMKILPPGRGLWAMGTDFIYERGSAALNNCGFVDVRDDLADSARWAMDMLMCGVGVGFSTQRSTLPRPHRPVGQPRTFVVPDSREGWADSVDQLIRSYYTESAPPIHFIYTQIRKAGEPLKGFGGVSGGHDPLLKLHHRLRDYLDYASLEDVPASRLITDVMNAIGACVVAGNVRRSAELATGSLSDPVFTHLKDYNKFPSRADIGWMSNNSVILSESEEFERLPEIADMIRANGEPGIINLLNIQKYGRIGKKMADAAIGFNPCAEIPLEDRELCNLVEVFPTRCDSTEDIWRMMELATFYASTVSLLPSHDKDTNAVVARNRRIGVSVSGVADWVDNTNLSLVTMTLRRGYEEHVEPLNRRLAAEAGVPASVRLTTVKPSGTISQLAGVSPGMHWPVAKHVIRRIRVAEDIPMVDVLINAGIPYERDKYSDRTLVFSFPLRIGQGKTRAVSEVSIWEQASLVAMLQREWADNAVSNTLTFRKSEANQIERVLAAFAPLTKSLSMLPDQAESDQAYEQLPYEAITKDQFKELGELPVIDWSDYGGSDGVDSKYCTTDACEIE